MEIDIAKKPGLVEIYLLVLHLDEVGILENYLAFTHNSYLASQTFVIQVLRQKYV